MAFHPESARAVEHIQRLAGPDKRIVFVSGNFNVLHPGHLRLLNFAADCGDLLVVGVNKDGASGAVVPQALRLEGIQALGVVNYSFVLRESAQEFIQTLKPAIVVKGKEHEGKSNPEQEVIARYGGQLLFSSGDVVFSSIDLMRREFSELNVSTIYKPADFPLRHQFTLDDVRKILGRMRDLRVLVLGDLIVDEYLACDALGMSQEDPTIVVTPILTERFVGGAGIVAAHAKGLGAHVELVSISGNDPVADFAASRLKDFGVETELFRDDSRPTTLKQRFRAEGKTLLRVSHLKQHMVDTRLQKKIEAAAASRISKADLVIFSDFNYGCLPQALVAAVSEKCMKRGVPMVADSQSSSQVGDISRFHNMLLLTPTEREARLAVRDFASGLVVLVDLLREKASAKHVILKLGSEGLLVHSRGDAGSNVVTDQLPALNHAPKDPAGAGDSLLVAASLALAGGADIWRASYVGALAAACQVGRIGNTPIRFQDIESELAT